MSFSVTWRKSVLFTVLTFFVVAAQNGFAGQEETARDADVQEHLSPSVINTYTSLTHLVHMICAEASSQFYDFYAPEAVYVRPFTAIGEFPNQNITLLGITLADQMTARINSDSLEKPDLGGNYDQWLQGVYQEIDGYLRVHISGINMRGERRSYVVNVEMSESLYRAMHTYIES